MGKMDKAAREALKARDINASAETIKILVEAWRTIQAHGWTEEETFAAKEAAADYLAEDFDLIEAAKYLRKFETAARGVRARLRGAAFAAVASGEQKQLVASKVGVSRQSLNNWLTPKR